MRMRSYRFFSLFICRYSYVTAWMNQRNNRLGGRKRQARKRNVGGVRRRARFSLSLMWCRWLKHASVCIGSSRALFQTPAGPWLASHPGELVRPRGVPRYWGRPASLLSIAHRRFLLHSGSRAGDTHLCAYKKVDHVHIKIFVHIQIVEISNYKNCRINFKMFYSATDIYNIFFFYIVITGLI